MGILELLVEETTVGAELTQVNRLEGLVVPLVALEGCVHLLPEVRVLGLGVHRRLRSQSSVTALRRAPSSPALGFAPIIWVQLFQVDGRIVSQAFVPLILHMVSRSVAYMEFIRDVRARVCRLIVM